MDWRQLLKNSYKQPWFKILLILICLFVFWLFRFSPKDNSGPILSYLPANTNFFYEWTDQESKNNDYFSQILIFSAQEPNNKRENLKNICNNNCPSINELVWFKVDSTREDNYLLKVADWPKQSLKSIRDNNPNIIFKQLSPYIYLVTPDKILADKMRGVVENKFAIVHETSGLNIYWQSSQTPDFLIALNSLIDAALTQDDIFMNLSVKNDKLSLKFFQVADNNRNRGDNFWAGVPLPQDFSLVMGFSKENSEKFLKDLIEQLIEPIFNTLPQQNFTQEDLYGYLVGNNMLVQQGEDWLLVSSDDWRPRIGKFLSDIQAKEVRKKLPDGTVYTELEVADDQVVLDQEFKGKKYWQIGNLFGYQINTHYYLTNRQYLLEQIIDRPSTLATWWPCGQIGSDISEVLVWSVPAMPDLPIKSFLQDKNIESLNIAAFNNDSVKGWQMCIY